MGELTGRTGPQTTLLVEKTKNGVKWSIPVTVPNLDQMSEVEKAALRVKLAAAIDDKILKDLETQAEQQKRPYSMGVRGRGLSSDVIVGDDAEHLPPLPDFVMEPYEMPDSHILYEKGRSCEPSTVLANRIGKWLYSRERWFVDGQLCLTTRAYADAIHRRGSAP